MENAKKTDLNDTYRFYNQGLENVDPDIYDAIGMELEKG